MEYELVRKTDGCTWRFRDQATPDGVKTLVGIVRGLAESERKSLVIGVEGAVVSDDAVVRFLRSLRRSVNRLPASVHVEAASEGARAILDGAAIPAVPGRPESTAPHIRLSMRLG